MKLIKRIDYLAALKAVKGAPGSDPCEYVEVNMS